MIVSDCVGNGLQQHCFTCLRLGNDKTTLTLSDRSEHIHNPTGFITFVAVAKKIEFLFWEQWSKEVEWNPISDEFRGSSIYEFNPYEREVLVSFFWRPDLSCYGISCLQGICLNLMLGYIYIIWRIQIIIVG